MEYELAFNDQIQERIDHLEEVLDTDPECINFSDRAVEQMRREITYLAFELCERERSLFGKTISEYYIREEEDGEDTLSYEE